MNYMETFTQSVLRIVQVLEWGDCGPEFYSYVGHDGEVWAKKMIMLSVFEESVMTARTIGDSTMSFSRRRLAYNAELSVTVSQPPREREREKERKIGTFYWCFNVAGGKKKNKVLKKKYIYI